MEATIDRFGRLVIPKIIRDELGLNAGTALELKKTPEGLSLRRVRKGRLVRKDGLLVFSGAKPTGDLEGAVEAMREQRIREVQRRAGL